MPKKNRHVASFQNLFCMQNVSKFDLTVVSTTLFRKVFKRAIKSVPFSSPQFCLLDTPTHDNCHYHCISFLDLSAHVCCGEMMYTTLFKFQLPTIVFILGPHFSHYSNKISLLYSSQFSILVKLLCTQLMALCNVNSSIHLQLYLLK